MSHSSPIPLSSKAELQAGSFVLYRSEAAIVLAISKDAKSAKIQIQTEHGKKVSTRPKDIYLLSSPLPGYNLYQVVQPLERSELQEAWLLLREMGQSCSLEDLAETVFAATGPCELYNAVRLLNDTPYFKGKADDIKVRSAEEVQEEIMRKEKKERETRRWQDFYQHYQEGNFGDEDLPFIAEIEAIAYGEKQNCRLFREMKLEASPENAHEWLLRQGLWNEQFNPYLQRNQICEQAPALGHSDKEKSLWQELLQGYQATISQFDLPPFGAEKAWQTPLSEKELGRLEQLVEGFCSRQDLHYPTDLDSGESPQFQQARQILASGIWNTSKRRNLTHLSAWAIDDPWSQDPDDAISWEEQPEGAALWVHIADPASLLPFGSTLTEEAAQRGATVYIPEGTCPMLPKELIGLLGLGLQPVSMALSVKMQLKKNPVGERQIPLATVETVELCRSWVRVQRRSYDEVDQILGTAHPLQQVWLLCQEHEKLRLGNQAIHFNMYNTRVLAGKPIRVETLPDTPSRNLVAEAMLMTGAAMAQFAEQHRLAIPFLSQASPKDTLPPLDSLSNMFLARKAMSPSMVQTIPQPHASIGVPMYTRGTSPLRRYLDLVTHQQFHAFLLQTEGRELRALQSEELLYCIAQAEIQLGRVNHAQRCSQQHWQLLYLKQEGKKRLYRAVVLQALPYRAKALCSLPELGLETLIFSKEALQPNQELRVVLKNVHLSQREAHFQIA